jgi:hypothetical protein
MGDAVLSIAMDRCSCILSPELLSEARYVYTTLRALIPSKQNAQLVMY